MALDSRKRSRSISHHADAKQVAKRQHIVEHDVQDDAANVEDESAPEDAAEEQPESIMEGDDEWEGFGAPEVQGEPGKLKRPETASTKSSTNKPPTREELRNILEASDLYKSNSFKLQIDALLPNVRPKESRVPPLDAFLLKLHAFLNSLPSTKAEHPLVVAKQLGKAGVAVPFPLQPPAEDTKWTFAFEKPSDIAIVGSWATKTGVKSKDENGPRWTVDVALEMPSTLFQEKDYLGDRFFHKRALYLASLAAAISGNDDLTVDTLYHSASQSNRLSSLVLRPRKDGSATDFTKLNAQVRLLPTLSRSSPISIKHLSPARANIRVRDSAQPPDAEAIPSATPLYNNALLLCSTPRAHLLSIHAHIQEAPAFRDALALLRVWANQRGFCEAGEGWLCVAGFEGRGRFWAALLAFLLVGEEPLPGASKKSLRRTVGRGLSSYQLFRAALDFIASHDFVREGVFTRGGNLYSREEYAAHHEAAFVDTCSINLLAGVPLSSLDLLRHDAQVAMDVLEGATRADIEPFAEIYMKDHQCLLTRFDVVIRVDLSKASPRKASSSAVFDCESRQSYLLSEISKHLRQGLGDRAKAVALLHPTDACRPISQGRPSSSLSFVHVGLVLNPSHAFRLVDHGPAAAEQDSPEVIAFRDFWGSKAELRRFKDGRIQESVVWDVSNSDERTRIPFMIVQHLLVRHLNIDGEADMQEFRKDLDQILRLPAEVSGVVQNAGVPAGFKAALVAFDTFVRQLKELDEELPLAVLNVSPISPYLRYTSVFAPVALPTTIVDHLPVGSRYLPAFEVVLQFERSARWPDDLAAIQKMKLAFFERIASASMSKVPGLTASVVVADVHSSPEISDAARLEVRTPEGWAFGARIWHDREELLLQRLCGKKNPLVKVPTPSNDAPVTTHAAEALQTYVRRFIHAPKHHRAVAALCHTYPAYPGTVRLVKRWLASHWMLGGHVREEAVELLCAAIFTEAKKGGVPREGEETRPGIPGTKEAGFYRVVEFLKDWSWDTGLFVPLYDKSEADTSDNASEPIKAGSGAGVWIISTAENPEGRIWTRAGPSALVARRINTLATECCGNYKKIEDCSLSPLSLFLHPKDDYDFIIHLEPVALARFHQNVDYEHESVPTRRKYANLPQSGSGNEDMSRVDFDPAGLFYDDLKRTYAGTAEFFYDVLGGLTIGAVWDPSVTEPRPFRVLSGYSSTPAHDVNDGLKSKEKHQVALNRAAILMEIQRLGEGLVKSIEV